MSTYALKADGDTYFGNKLHSDSWLDASDTEKDAALFEATQAINQLRFAGLKAAGYTASLSTSCESTIATAEATQELQFPRGADTEIPTQIKYACLELALYLLENDYNADLELQSQNVISQGISSARVTYGASRMSPNVIAGIPSIAAWRLLLPYLDNPRNISFRRV